MLNEQEGRHGFKIILLLWHLNYCVHIYLHLQLVLNRYIITKFMKISYEGWKVAYCWFKICIISVTPLSLWLSDQTSWQKFEQGWKTQGGWAGSVCERQILKYWICFCEISPLRPWYWTDDCWFSCISFTQGVHRCCFSNCLHSSLCCCWHCEWGIITCCF